ncbi:sensor histidine kinase [Ideonella livida]|uniref:histidine kinase n=1 Tax=Ideonella livida TaxID=2707176 RepID=A0A7C9TK42_9BURK|nr:ATP-binding protein [Ideonella livida]NDY91065.1 hypothetical protein [Ideonella livida]
MARWNTLFTRLVLVQTLGALALLLVFGLGFYVERNRTIGQLVGERWAPALLRLSQLPAAQAAQDWPAGVPRPRLQAEGPGPSLPGDLGGPRTQALRAALLGAGLQVQDLRFTAHPQEAGRPLLWLRLDTPEGPRWLGLDDALVETRLPLRLLLTLGLSLAVTAGLSAWAARRLSRPLEALRQHLHAHPPGQPAPAPTLRGATAEVQAIAADWHQLHSHHARQLRERELMLAGISHDLRSPLARIRMAAELLPEAPDLTARRETIVRNVEVADRLIGSFLDQVRAGTLPLDETVDLHEVARQVLTARLAPGEALPLDPGAEVARLQLQGPAPCLRRNCNALLMERALGNLVDNALRHGAPPVCVRLRPQADGGLWLEVDDHGPGLGPQDPAHLLQAFARGDASRHTPGSGLGLAVVAQVMHRQGGTVSLEALAPRGCRVRLSWPAP